MSSILKAIRKAEDEKRAATHATPDLRTDQGTAPAKAKPFLPLFAGMFLGVFCVGLVFFLTSQKEIQSQPPAASAVMQQEGTAATASSPGHQSESVPVVVMPAEPVSVSLSPAEEKETAAGVVEDRSAAMLPGEPDVRLPETIKPSTLPEVFIPEASHSPVKEDLLKPVETPTPPVIPDLIVSEIFIQDDSANSMAVVNDLPVMVGTPVGTAVVAEIHPDHVLFEIDGHPLPVYLQTQSPPRDIN